MQILLIILVLVIVFLIWFFNTSLPYPDKKIDSLDKYFYVLKYRGIADESLSQNASLNIIEPNLGNVVGLVKYKEKGNVGLYLGVSYSNLIGKEKMFVEKIENLKLNYFNCEGGIFNDKHYFIDIKINFKLCKNILKFIWNEIYDENLVFELYFKDNICKDSTKIIDFKDAKELEEKGINIDIPITKWQWLIYKLKGKKTYP